MSYMTLADWARHFGPDGSIDDVGELLAQCNEIFDDMLIREGNMALGHVGTVRTGLPQGTWRNMYQGVSFTKSTVAQVTDGIGELFAYSRIDRSLADLEGNVAALRLTEDNAHLEGLSQQMANVIFYGNVAVTQAQFTHIKVAEGPSDSRFGYLSDVLPATSATGSSRSTWCPSGWPRR